MLVMKSIFLVTLDLRKFSPFQLLEPCDKKDFFLVGEGSEELSHFYFSLNGSISIYFHLPLPIFAFLVSRFLAPTHNFWRERLRKKKVLVSGKRNLQQIPFSRNKNFFFVHPFWRWIAHLVQNVHTAKSRRCAEKKTFHHKDRPDDGHANGWPWPPPACRRSSYLLLLLPLHEAEAKQLL